MTLAVFGMPVLHEDDAVRALRAAQEMSQKLALLNEELRARWGIELAIRTGVNTGEILVAGPAPGQSLALGNAMNIGARLQQAAAAGEILLSESTWGLAHHAVQTEPIQPLRIKGKVDPITAFRLLESPAASGPTRHGGFPMVGREADLEVLIEAFQAAAVERAFRLVTVVGSAGVGKSRLLEAFSDRIGERSTVLEGRCLPYGDGITFWPLLEVVRQAARIEETDRADDVRAKIGRLLATDDRAELVVDRIAAAIGFGSTTASGAEVFWATRRLLESLARDRPLVVVFEDVHWAEPTFLDLIEHVVAAGSPWPVMVLAAARQELLEQRPHWGTGPTARILRLRRLDDLQSEQLLGNLLEGAPLARVARDRILAACAGNPLFVEQMVSMLVEEGSLLRKEDGWVLQGELSELRIPPTVQALLAARLDRLPEPERAVLGRAAIVGALFYLEALDLLSEGNAIRPAVDALVVRDLIAPAASDREGLEAFEFRHILIRDAAYGGLPKALRADLHGRFASWLESVPGERTLEHEEIVGYHLEQAYRARQELGSLPSEIIGLGERAAGLLRSAGSRAVLRSDMPAAIKLYSRVHALLPPGTTEHRAAQLELATVLCDASHYAEAEHLLVELAGDAEAGRDAGFQARVSECLLEARGWRGELWAEEALVRLEPIVQQLVELDEQRTLPRAFRFMGLLRFWRGSSAAATEAIDRSIQSSITLGDRREELMSLATIAPLLWGPLPREELEARAARMLTRAGDDIRVQAMGQRLQAYVEAMVGRFDQAQRLCTRATEVLHDFQLRVDAASASGTHAMIELLADDPRAAEDRARSAYQDMRETGLLTAAATIGAILSRAVAAQGRYQEAEQLADSLLADTEPEDVHVHTVCGGVVARSLARRGQASRGEEVARNAVRMAAATDYLEMHADALVDLADVVHLQGRAGEAAQHLQQALELYRRRGNAQSAARAVATIQALGGHRTA